MYTCCKLQTDKQKKNHIKSTHKSYILFSLSGVGGGEGGWGVEGKVGGRLVHQSKNGLNWLCSRTTRGHIGAFIMQRSVWENIECSCDSEILILSNYYTHFHNKMWTYI